MSLRSSRCAEDGSLVVRYSRGWGALCLLFILILASRAAEDAALTATAFSTACLVLVGALAAAGAWSFLRARPVLVVDGSGLEFCRTGIRLEWSEIAAVAIEEWQSPFDLSRRLTVRAVRPRRLDELWAGAPFTFGLTPPSDGRISLMLNFLTPRSSEVADAIREHSAGQLVPERRRVARRPFGEPEPGA